MSSNITTEKYSLPRIERIKHYLESCAEKGRSRFYEIYVDNLKAVDKTDDTQVFDEYQVYVDENTQMVKIVIYTSTENSPRNDKFIFTLNQAAGKQESLNGAEVETRISNAIQQERERNQLSGLQKELEVKQQELAEAEEYIEKLEENLEGAQKELVELKERKVTLSEMSAGKVAGYLTEYLVQNHPAIAKKIPGISTLSGFLTGNEGADNESNSAEPAASFSKKAGMNGVEKDPSDAIKLQLFSQMEKAFSEEQLKQVVEIIHGLMYQPEMIETLHPLVVTEQNPENE